MADLNAVRIIKDKSGKSTISLNGLILHGVTDYTINESVDIMPVRTVDLRSLCDRVTVIDDSEPTKYLSETSREEMIRVKQEILSKYPALKKEDPKEDPLMGDILRQKAELQRQRDHEALLMKKALEEREETERKWRLGLY